MSTEQELEELTSFIEHLTQYGHSRIRYEVLLGEWHPADFKEYNKRKVLGLVMSALPTGVPWVVVIGEKTQRASSRWAEMRYQLEIAVLDPKRVRKDEPNEST